MIAQSGKASRHSTSMRSLLGFVALLLIVSLPLSAQSSRGEVHFLGAAYWVAWPDFPTAAYVGDIGIYKPVPYWAGHFLMPGSSFVVFHDRHTVSFWDGVPIPLSDPRPAYSNIFSDEAELTEIAPMRSGHFLVAEAQSDSGAKLIEFDVQRKIAEYRFGGARHIELLSDQCSLLYTTGDARVRRFNICTRQTESDFASLLPGESAGSVRQMPNGNVLVATGKGVVTFQADGSFWTYSPFDGVTHVALTPDGTSFWAASPKPELRHVDPSDGAFDRVDLGYSGPAVDVQDLVVVGEWRASMPVARSRGVRRR